MTANSRETDIINETDDLETCLVFLEELQGIPAWDRFDDGSTNSAMKRIYSVIAGLELELHDHWLTGSANHASAAAAEAEFWHPTDAKLV